MMSEFDIFADDPAYDDDNPNEGYFSRAACDSCNDTLGGQRYDIVGLNAGDDPELWVEFSVCVDCYYELIG